MGLGDETNHAVYSLIAAKASIHSSGLGIVVSRGQTNYAPAAYRLPQAPVIYARDIEDFVRMWYHVTYQIKA